MYCRIAKMGVEEGQEDTERATSELKGGRWGRWDGERASHKGDLIRANSIKLLSHAASYFAGKTTE